MPYTPPADSGSDLTRTLTPEETVQQDALWLRLAHSAGSYLAPSSMRDPHMARHHLQKLHYELARYLEGEARSSAEEYFDGVVAATIVRLSLRLGFAEGRGG